MKIEPLLEQVKTEQTLPALARELFEMQAAEHARQQVQLEEVEGRLMAWHRAHEGSRRLARIPGVGPIGAAMLVMASIDWVPQSNWALLGIINSVFRGLHAGFSTIPCFYHVLP